MNCHQVRQHWHLFHDSEGDAELQLQINEHLGRCAECSDWFTQQSALEEALTHALRDGAEPSPDLWGRIEGSLTPSKPVASRRWLLLGSVTIVLAASLLVVVGSGVRESPDSGLASLSVALHDQLTSGEKVPSFVSTSHLDIENYLRQHVNFPVRCPPREDAGFAAKGGGTGKLARDSVAYVVGHVDGEAVSLFILSRESLAHFPEARNLSQRGGSHYSREGDFDIAMTQFDQNLVLAVGKTQREKLHRLLTAYGSYPHRL